MIIVKPVHIDIALHSHVDKLIYADTSTMPSSDLSHGTNRLGISSSLRSRIIDASHTNLLTEYDSPSGPLELRTAIAAYETVLTGVPTHPKQVVITHGAAEALDYLFNALAVLGHRRALILDAQFPTVYRVAEAAGMDVSIALSGKASVEDRHSSSEFTAEALDELLATTSSDVIVLSQPGNPTGRFLDENAGTVLVQHCRRKEIHLVVDRACDDVPSPHWNPGISLRHLGATVGCSVHVVDSFSKRRAIPGLRAGYMITDARVRRAVAKRTIGRTTTTISAQALVWDLETWTKLSKLGIQHLTYEEQAHVAFIYKTHAQVSENLTYLRQACAPYLLGPIQHDAGINVQVDTVNPRPYTDRQMVEGLLGIDGLATYPVACFEGADGHRPTLVFRNRVTVASDPTTFRHDVLTFVEALNRYHNG